MKPGKILFLINDTTYAYNLRRELIGQMVREGYETVVVSQPVKLREELKRETGAQLIDLQIDRHGVNPLQDIQLFFRYLRILQQQKPDLVLSFNIKPNVYGGLACRLLKLCYMPNITGLGTAVENVGLMQLITTRLYKWGIGGAECVFFQNKENVEFMRRHKMLHKKSRSCLLPGSGVNLSYRKMRDYPQDGKIHFLFAARIMKEKGIDLFLAAAEKYHNEDVLFEVCGGCDDEKYRQILSCAHNSGVIIYHGNQTDMNPHYERCSCLLYPSYYPEGMSNVLLEAAASGRPAIAANRSGCREIITDEVTGYIVPANDKEAVLNAVKKFLSLTWEQRKNMGLAARIKVEKEFDRQIVIKKYLEQIEEHNKIIKKRAGDKNGKV